MIKMVALVGGTRTLFLGFDRNNTDRMHADMPIALNLPELSQEPIERVVMIAGETVRDVYEQFRRVGFPLPEDMPEGL